MTATATKEKTIAFNAEMVRAILRDEKTQTRRPIKPQPPEWINELHGGEFAERAPYDLEDDEMRPAGFGFQTDLCMWQCPWRVGDTLRISEEVTVTPADRRNHYALTFAADGLVERREGAPELMAKICAYKKPRLRGVSLPVAYARRDRLEVTEVRVQRLNEISGEDCIREGATNLTSINQRVNKADPTPFHEQAEKIARDRFARLWESAYGPEAWFANPWVWAISFRRLA
jgi:hypothetical protein